MIDPAFKYTYLLGTILIQTAMFYWLVTQTLTHWQDPGDPGTTVPPGHPEPQRVAGCRAETMK